MIDKQKLIQRHKNPVGLSLRVVTYLMIGFGFWSHQLALIMGFLLVDILNWIFMPAVKPENESRIVNAIVEKEIVWLKSPTSIAKMLSIVTGAALILLLFIGLWNQNWPTLLVAFVSLVLLKQLLVKTTNTKTITHN